MQKNDYIIRRSKDMWHFFHVDNDGLCVKKKQDGRWGNSQVLLENVFFDFSVLCDGQDNLHLVCQDMDGNVLYLAYHHEQWHKYTLMKSKTDGAYTKYFKLLLTGSHLQLFYTIRSGNKSLLVHQFPGDDKDPVIVDVVRDSLRPFFVVCDDFMNTWIYYQNIDSAFGCRMYSWSSKSLGDFIHTGETNCDCPFVYLDEYSRHHIVCMQKGSLLYLQRNNHGEICEKKSVVATDTPVYLPIILGDNKKLWLMWRQDNKAHYSVCPIDTLSWSSPSMFISPAGTQVQLFAFQKESICSYCWGYLDRGEIHLFAAGSPDKAVTTEKRPTEPQIKPVGKDVEDFAARHLGEFNKRPPMPEPKPRTSVDVTKINIMINSLNDQVNKLKKQVDRLSLKNSQLEEDFERFKCLKSEDPEELEEFDDTTHDVYDEPDDETYEEVHEEDADKSL